jgi:hypothetical protein
MGRRRWMTQFWRHPQQLWLRRAMFQVHLWLGVALGAYIVAIGISGSILVFKDELMPRPHVLLTPAACTAERLAAGLQAAVLVHPGWTPVLASCPIEGDPWITVNLSAPANETGGKQETEYIDPGSGRVAGSVVRDRTWVGWVERLHLDLLLRRGGSTWNGVGAVVLLLLVGSGLVLWWPGIRHWARGFTVDLRRSWKRINWDLHNAVGIWTVLFTLIWGVTGVYFTWPRPFERVVAAVSPIPSALYPAAEVARLGRRPPPRLGQAAPEVSTLLWRVVTLAPALPRYSPSIWRAGVWATSPPPTLSLWISSQVSACCCGGAGSTARSATGSSGRSCLCTSAPRGVWRGKLYGAAWAWVFLCLLSRAG